MAAMPAARDAPELVTAAAAAPADDGNSSDDGLFGAAGDWMTEHEDEGAEELEVSRAPAVASEEMPVPENWKFKRKDYWDGRFETEQEFEW